MGLKVASIPSLCIAIVSITIGFFHLLSYYDKGRNEKLHLSFFQVCLAISGFLLISAGLYNSDSVAEGSVWQRYQFLFASIIATTFFIFIFHLVRKEVSVRTIFTIVLIYIPVGLAATFTDYATKPLHPAIKHIDALNITYYEAELGNIIVIYSILLFGGMLYSLYLLLNNYRRGATDLFGIIIAIVIFFIFSTNDILIGAGIYTSLYLMEYGFFIVLLSMAHLLHKRFILFYRSTEEKARNLENIIEEQTIELKRALQRAEKSDRAKTSFVSTMSHEIRTPLNGIFGMTELLLKTDLNEEQKEFMGTIRLSMDHLLQIINDILDFTRITENKIVLESTPLDLEKFLFQTINTFKTQADSKEIAMNLRLQRDLPRFILGDEVRLRQVLINLIGNALKFTPQHGQITIEVTRSEEHEDFHLQFVVSDTGIGITESQLNKLFRPFTQAHEGIERTFGGTGLGLAISARLVQAMGGEIWVTSKPGEGSRFSFTISSGAADTQPEIEEPTDINNHGIADANLAEHMPLEILVVDDSDINIKIALRIFEFLGYAIECARDGNEAISKSLAKHYDIIFMDIHMPNTNGISATKSILNQSRNSIKPVIVAMTADVIEENRDVYTQAGMSDFIAKPFQTDDFKKILFRWGQK
ncbi:MAG: response regulator [Leptospiraceae bacterium]|nr:response regulator [Leptospiraceae bacterium]